MRSRRVFLAVVVLVAIAVSMASVGAADVPGSAKMIANVDTILPCTVSNGLFGGCSGDFGWLAGSPPNVCATQTAPAEATSDPGSCRATGSGPGTITRDGCASWTIGAGGGSLEFSENGVTWAVPGDGLRVEVTGYTQAGIGDRWRLVPGVYPGGGGIPSGSYFRGREVGGSRTLTVTLAGTALAPLQNCSAGSTISSVNLTVRGTRLIEDL